MHVATSSSSRGSISLTGTGVGIAVVPELERVQNMPHRRYRLHFSVYAGLCWNSATRYLEGAPFDALNQGNFLPKTFAAGLGKIYYTQMLSFATVSKKNCDAVCSTYPFFPLLIY